MTNDNQIANLMKDFIAYDRFKRKMNIGFNIRLSELQALMIYSVVKEYKEDGVKVTQYDMRKLKPVPMPRKWRKPGSR